MEKSGIVFIYKETFQMDVTPFSQVSLESELRKTLADTFKSCGGTYLLDLGISTTEKWRISYWQDRDGYKKWESDKRLIEYFRLRSEYNDRHRISTSLQGPIDAKELINA